MGDLSSNFSREEFECNCGCGFDDVVIALVDVLQEAREELGCPITVTSACRCKEYNSKVSVASKSQHLLGTAADIQVSGCTPDYVYKYFNDKYPNKYGIGKYKSFVHIDVRRRKARW